MPAILAGSTRKMSQLDSPDRCWAVAGLTLAGLTAEDIADRMDCSLRLVRSIRAEDMTQVCSYSQVESKAFDGEMRLLRAGRRSDAVHIEALEAELERTRAKLDNLIDARVVGSKICGRCHTPMTGYNLYVWKGREYCRECHRTNQKIHREVKSLAKDAPFALARGLRAVVNSDSHCNH